MVNEVENLFDQVRLCWHAMVNAFEHLHERESVTLAMRAVLEYLLVEGPATVPNIARARLVSRQHIQMQVSALEQRRFVTIETNPDHQRSVLVKLTSSGRTLIERMRRRERRYLEKLALSATKKDIALAAKTLGAIRDAIEAAS